MKFKFVNSINLKKLKKYKTKSLFLIIPITFLMILGIVISSQATNILDASQQTIFGTASESGRLIEVSSEQSSGGTQGDESFRKIFGGATEYTDADIDVVSSIDNVDTAALTVKIPISQIEINDLFEDTSILLSNIRTLNEDISAQYTDKDFTYIEGNEIPIILNANSFILMYEDWRGEDEISISIASRGPGTREAIENQAPFKTQALQYDKDQIIGQTITVSFGGLDPIQTYEQELTASGILFRNLTDEQITEKEGQQQSDLETYWNYKQINEPLTYTFKVVGILEDENNFATYVPEEFANTLMENYVQNQLDARTDTELTTDLLNTAFYGMTYDGLELDSAPGTGGGSFKIGQGALHAEEEESETLNSYTIPGLVIETARKEGDADAFEERIFGSTAEAIGVLENPIVFEQAVHASDAIVLKMNDIANRSQIVEDLNDAGYAYQDLNDQEVFTELQATMQSTTTIATISFVILSAIIIILTMGKFVSESRKEIGVFRAIGATKGDIKQLFMSQAIMYTVIGYIIGAIIGIGLVFALAKPVQLWFDSFIEKTIGETFDVVQQTDAGTFANIDWQMFGIYTILLLVIAIVISIIPATRASRISPIEAIKNE